MKYNGGNFDLFQGDFCADIPGISGRIINIGQTSSISYQVIIQLLYSNFDAIVSGQTASIYIQLENSFGIVVSRATTICNVPKDERRQLTAIGSGNLIAGNYTVVAKVLRTNNSGNWNSSGGSLGVPGYCNDLPVQQNQFIAQVFPH